MMMRAFRFLSQEVQSVHAAAAILGIAAVLSSALGLLRDRLLAHTFGAGIELDVYYAAFRIPDVIFVATTALVSVYVLVPELSRRSERDARAYLDTLVLGFSALMALVGAGAFFLAPSALAVLFPELVRAGFGDELVVLSRIMLLQPVLLGFSNLCAAVIQLKRRFLLYSLSPALYNAGIIAGVVFLYPMFGFSGLAWGVVLGAALHMLVQVPAVMRDGFFGFPSFVRWNDIAMTIRASLPRSLALAMNQLTFLGLTMIAGTLAAGSITSFTLAYNLYSVPLAIIGASYSVAAFPTLAAAFARGERSVFLANVALAARHIIFWSLPAIGLIVVLRAHVVRAVLGSGLFDWTDTRITAAAFALFSIALAAQGILLLLTRAYYAAGRSVVPLAYWGAIGAAALLLSYTFVYVLESPAVLEEAERLLRVSELPGTQVLALALALAVATLGGACALIADFEFRFGGFVMAIRRTALRSFIATLAAAGVAYGVLYVAGALSPATTFFAVFSYGFVAALSGVCAAVSVHFILGSEELFEMVSAVRARIAHTAGSDAARIAAKERTVGSAEG